MRAGWLRHRVQLQQVTRTVGSLGEPVETWTTFATVWASVEPQRAREYVAAQSEQAQGAWIIKMRWRNDVTRSQRALWNGHTLEIESAISPFERRRELELVCREIL